MDLPLDRSLSFWHDVRVYVDCCIMVTDPTCVCVYIQVCTVTSRFMVTPRFMVTSRCMVKSRCMVPFLGVYVDFQVCGYIQVYGYIQVCLNQVRVVTTRCAWLHPHVCGYSQVCVVTSRRVMSAKNVWLQPTVCLNIYSCWTLRANGSHEYGARPG